MALLVVCGILAIWFLWIVERRADETVTTLADTSIRTARISETIAAIGAAQRSYVAPGQLDEPWFEQTAALLAQLSIDLAEASADLRSPGATEAMAALAESSEALIVADARIRQNLAIGQDLMASDVIFSDGQHIIDTMTVGLRDLQASEQAAHQTRLASLTRQRWAAFGTAALLGLVGFLALAKPTPLQSRAIDEPTRKPSSVPEQPVEVHDSPTEQRPPLDLTLVAGLCTDLSRVTSPSALPDLLGRTAQILDASGVILWISAGEQLFPVTGHGYAPEVLARMAPISRDDDNAAATAWRTGQLTVVQSVAPSDSGAIVAPLLGLDECVGVLAAEVPHGVESRPATHALATVVAAQLATVIPAWPGASLTTSGDAGAGEIPGDPASPIPNSDASTAPETETLEVRSA